MLRYIWYGDVRWAVFKDKTFPQEFYIKSIPISEESYNFIWQSKKTHWGNECHEWMNVKHQICSKTMKRWVCKILKQFAFSPNPPVTVWWDCVTVSRWVKIEWIKKKKVLQSTSLIMKSRNDKRTVTGGFGVLAMGNGDRNDYTVTYNQLSDLMEILYSTV